MSPHFVWDIVNIKLDFIDIARCGKAVVKN